jgi:hypothetical protein
MPHASRTCRSEENDPRVPATRNLALEFFFVGAGALLGCTALQELRYMPRLAGFAGRAFGRIRLILGCSSTMSTNWSAWRRSSSAIIGGCVEVVKDYADAHPTALHRLDQRAEIAVAGEQHHVVDVAGEFHGVDGELDIHVAFDLAAAGLVDDLPIQNGQPR